jgi:hypothetical protein
MEKIQELVKKLIPQISQMPILEKEIDVLKETMKNVDEKTFL